ncbi:transketolase [Chlorobium sp. N1]|uniref:transketolase n=1 Tax=Chlorobium sp. N1 TaxID=2491138 RepID=UPI001038BA5B|nr:transketolase [Chlorobium sp. N1]TCD47883.1 transketolase [Chlorobium sp. N1]
MNENPEERQAIDTARLLAVDMVEKARSGHPGMPLGAAPMLYVLFGHFMRHSPHNPAWANRDRFVLSAGHASALLYAMLHLTGYDLPMEELRRFRQLGSRTPGHPERGLTPGVETTTGPLGQGIATAVGMAIAERRSAALLNRPGMAVIDYRTCVLASDGDLMEGISGEAASLAGHLRLGKLICLYDSNHISIEGPTSLAFSEDVAGRYRAYGWQVLEVKDGNDLQAIREALRLAGEEPGRPSLIRVRTHIGYGSPHRQDSAKAHGEPLGTEETALIKKAFGFPPDASFHVPAEVRRHFMPVRERGESLEKGWNDTLLQYGKRHPEAARLFEDALRGRLAEGWEKSLPVFRPPAELATRQASHRCLEAMAAHLSVLIGGSADLAPSCGTILQDSEEFTAESSGATLHFGVREHAMGAILNGIALSGILRPYGATFLVFADYMKPAVRLSALMRLPVLFIFTHDSIALGEDGPTHQPVEQLAMLRAMPGLTTVRPADANETRAAWALAPTLPGPVALVLTRQKLPVLDPTRHPTLEGTPKGGYVIADWTGDPSPEEAAIIIATGSEVHPALQARELLEQEGVPTRVVSMPSFELFLQQPRSWRESVLPPAVTDRVSVEAASPFGWERFTGTEGRIVAIDRFGASGPGTELQEAFGFTPSRIADAVRELKHKRP